MPKLNPTQYLRPSFPKAVVCAVLLGGFILWKFRAPIQVTHAVHKKPVAVANLPAPVSAAQKIQLLPAPVVGGNPPLASTPVKQKVAHKKRRHPRKLVRTQAMKRLLFAAAKMEPEFDWPEVDETQFAVNVSNPLEEIAERELSLPYEDTDLSLNRVTLAAPQEIESPVIDRRLQVVIGSLVQNDFDEFRASLALQKKEFAEFEKPEPELVRPKAKQAHRSVKPKVKRSLAKAKIQPKKTDAVAELITPTLVAKTVEPPALVAKVQITPEKKAALLNQYLPEIASAGPVAPEAQINLPPVVATQPQAIAPTTHAVPEQWVAKDEKNVLVVPSPTRPATEAGKISVNVPDVVKKELEQRRDPTLNEVLMGKLELTNGVADWVDKRGLSIQLSLHPVGSLESQDTIFIDYQFPSEEFRIEPRGLQGKYNLQASFYLPNQAEAVVRVFHSRVISADNQTQYIHFKIDNQMIKDAMKASEVAPSNGVWFTANFYKVDTSKHKQQTEKKAGSDLISEGIVSFVGFPEWGSVSIRGDGTVKSALPARSEVLLKATSNGFFPTYRVVPTFSSALHSLIYLANEKELDPIIRYFTGRPQNKPLLLAPGLIFGRIFDPLSFRPRDLVPVEISHSSTADQLLPATTETGFFGFSNVVPSERALSRGSKDRRLLVNVLEGAAQYIEFGRGGKKDLFGKLSNLYGDIIPPAKVRLAGDKGSESWTDDSNVFRIEEIDFSPGIVTVEVEAPGYPLTWYNLSWDPQQPERERAVRLVSKDKIKGELINHAQLPQMNEHLGQLIGSLDSSYFGKNACVYVHLLGTDGIETAIEHGPFPFAGGTRNNKDPHCLSASGALPSEFAYYNLRDGEYILKVQSAKGKLLRAHVLRVGNGRVTVTVN